MSRPQDDPPAAALESVQPHFIVGQDPHGWWLALDTRNLAGGLFKSREDAIHFVGIETGRRAGACELATVPLQLRF